MNDGLGTLKSALRTLDLLFRNIAAGAEAAELLQAGGDNLCQVRLFAAICNLDRLIQTTVLQRTGNLRRKLARLLAGGREVKRAINDHRERPDRHDEKQNDDATGQPAHVAPKPHNTEADLSLLEIHSGGSMNVSEICEMSENHWNISS